MPKNKRRNKLGAWVFVIIPTGIIASVLLPRILTDINAIGLWGFIIGFGIATIIQQ